LVNQPADSRQPEEAIMNSDQMKGKWTQLKGEAKSRWGKLTDDDLMQIEGNRDKLVGKIQEKYGTARDAAEREVDEWAEAR
jgi:uncharacterized protein YjbJ (UPF0337 family)